MRKLTVLLIFFMIVFGMNAAGAEELSDAYMKEYTFLKAQKEELVKRLENERNQQEIEITAAKNKVRSLQDKYVGLSRELKEIEQRIENAQDTFQDITSNEEIINSVIIRAKMELENHGVWVDDEAVSQVDMMAHAFTAASNLYNTLSSIRIRDGEFYLMDGSIAQGEIIEVGNIAAYGISTKIKGALAPAGNGEYKIWNQPGSHDDAQALYDKQLPATLDIFIYENRDKDVEYQKEKTVQDVIEGGGIIGYVILGLGILGVFLVLARGLFLLRAGSRVKRIPGLVYEKIESGKVSEAYEAIKDFKGSTARVIRATLRNITSDRDHIEDIITESILNENRALDRFGSFILVIAAVSPLLGLLGTVTGMISTFDVITIYGTGDPKLLSGGISEALVTTMLGLFVAIPLILLGNLANGWAENIKGSMEQSALHVVNLHEKYAAAK